MELEAQQRRQRREEKRRQVESRLPFFCCLPDPSPSAQISLHDLPFQRELAASRAGGGGAGGAPNANAVMIDLTDENAAPAVPAAQPAVQPPRHLPPYMAAKAGPVGGGGGGASASVNFAAAAAAAVSKQMQVGQPQERARQPYSYVPPRESEMDSIANMARALRDQALKANLVQQQKQAAAPPRVVPPPVPPPVPQHQLAKHAHHPYPGECHPSSLCQTMTFGSISQGYFYDSAGYQPPHIPHNNYDPYGYNHGYNNKAEQQLAKQRAKDAAQLARQEEQERQDDQDVGVSEKVRAPPQDYKPSPRQACAPTEAHTTMQISPPQDAQTKTFCKYQCLSSIDEKFGFNPHPDNGETFPAHVLEMALTSAGMCLQGDLLPS
jgi:hypothetical protein